MVIRRLIPVLLIGVAIALSGCDVEDGLITDKTAREFYSRASDFSKSLSFDMTPEMKEISLKTDIKVNSGRLSLVAINPDEEVVWNSVYRAGHRINTTHDFEPVEGTWTVYYEGEKVIADVDLRWIGRF